MWTLDTSAEYIRRAKKFDKKRPRELAAVLVNLDTLMMGLNNGLTLAQVRTFGFIHCEPLGVLAIDQSGGRRGVRLRQTRLYVYPNEGIQVMDLITLGDKETQQKDIIYSAQYVESIRQTQGTPGHEYNKEDTV